MPSSPRRVVQDNENGMISTGGFILFSPFSPTGGGPNNISKRSLDDKYPQALFRQNKLVTFGHGDAEIMLRDKIPFSVVQKIPMIDVNNNAYKYFLNNANYSQYKYSDWAYLVEVKNRALGLTYDQYKRIGYTSDNGLIFFCLDAATYSSGDDWNYLRWNPGIIDSDTMQWDLKLSDDKKYLRLVNKKFPDLFLGNNGGYLVIQRATPPSGYDEIAIDWNNLKNKNMINPSYINNSYEWFDLRWIWNNVTYYPTQNGGSYSKRGYQQILFNREFGYILYVDASTGDVFALTNKRNDNDDWNWISWEKITEEEFKNLPTNPRRMWNMQTFDESRSIVLINCVYKDDILWIQTRSTNWGYYFTSKKNKDYSSNSNKEHRANWKNNG